MKKLISLLLALIMLLSITAGLDFSAYADMPSSGSCGDNVTYKFNSSTGTLTISGTGAMKDFILATSPFYSQTSIKTILINSGVTSIGNNAFKNCSGLRSVTIGNSVTSIGKNAFEECSGLGSITIPDSVILINYSAFYKCTGLTSVTIGNSVTSICEYAFCNCTGLKNVTIPDSVTRIYDYAFSLCKGLTSVTIGNSVTTICTKAFSSCNRLISITIPNSVISIWEAAFQNCINLKNVYYAGSESEWISVNIGDQNNYLINANIYYNYSSNPEKKPCITHIWGNGAISVNPTCTENGLKLFTCTVCGATLREVVPATHSYNTGVITTQPTCIKTGKKTITCMVCGDYYIETVPATGIHTYDNGKITTQPTCTRTGIKTYTCTVCGTSYTETVPALGHNYVAKITKAATCENSGIKTYTCSHCSASYIETVPALGHNYVAKKTKAATCENSGIKTYTCSRCSASYTETIKALGHNYKTTVKKATPKSYGYSDTVCSRCGYEHYKEIPSVYAKLSKTEYTYDGKVKKPKVTVYNDYGNKISNEHYKVVYPKGRKKIGKYTVKIVLKGDYYSGTIKKSFNIVKKVKKPAQVKGVTSVITVDNKKYKVQYVAKWKKVEGASGYQVKTGGDDGGGKFWSKAKNIKGASKTKYTYNMIYGSDECMDFVKVRAYKTVNGKKVYGKWSKVAYTKTRNIG